MSKKFFPKTSAVFALCGLLLLTLLTSGGSASAQNVQVDRRLKTLVRVVNSNTAAPHDSVVVRAVCPLDYIAQRGQVKVSHAAKVNIFFLSRNAFVIQSSQPLEWRRGWMSKVLNKTRLPLRVQVTATCVL